MALISRPQTLRAHHPLRRIAVDLTPLIAGPDNGGAGLVATTLVSQLSRIAADCEFVLLTSAGNHAALELLDQPNTRRLNVDALAGNGPPADPLTQLQAQMRLLACLKIQLLFCPVHVPPWFDPMVPIVSVVYDLQYRHYPQFFTSEQRFYREDQFRHAWQLSDRLICISDHTRQAVLANCDVDPARLAKIPASIFGRLKQPIASTADTVLKQYGLHQGRFLLYPANFWPHKNHRLLLSSLRLYQSLYPDSDLMLVCTGAPGAAMDRLREVSSALGLADRVAFLGYVRGEDELPSLLNGCLALIFPSLYEGFGIPVLEAMAFGKPVLCSNVTALPEVAGTAALFFNPVKPLEIVRAIAQLEQIPELASELIRHGSERAAVFPDPEELARQYLYVFNAAVRSPRPVSTALHGVYQDGWTSQRVVVTYPANPADRQLEMELQLPGNSPYEEIRVAVVNGEGDSWGTAVIHRGESHVVQRAIPSHAGYVQLLIDPSFQPSVQQGADDYRVLGCICESARIVSSHEAINLLMDEHLNPIKA